MPELLNPDPVNAQPRPIELTEEDRRRIEATLRAMDQLLEMGDEEEQAATYAALVAGLEENPVTFRRWYPE